MRAQRALANGAPATCTPAAGTPATGTHAEAADMRAQRAGNARALGLHGNHRPLARKAPHARRDS